MEQLAGAYGDALTLNAPLLKMVEQLRRAGGYSFGILSNVTEAQWGETCRRFAFLSDPTDPLMFALSYRVGACKPERAIFRAAVELARVLPHEILFVDDKDKNVLAAHGFGLQVLRYTSVGELINVLQSDNDQYPNCCAKQS